jgi:hypothetical protein
MEKIIIQKPVFYQESPFKPLYQLMAYFPGTEDWVMHNVVGGSEGIQKVKVDFNKVGHDIARFNTVKDDLVNEYMDTARALLYLESLGIKPAMDFVIQVNEAVAVYKEAAVTTK